MHGEWQKEGSNPCGQKIAIIIQHNTRNGLALGDGVYGEKAGLSSYISLE
jgi:hypothetical protein